MKTVCFALVIGAFSLLSGAAVSAGEVDLSAGVAGHISVRVVSLKEARFATVIKQKHDFSCGSAALASLLTYHYDRPTSEEELFSAMFAAGDQEKIRRIGFSLLDMKDQLERLGYRADAFKISLARQAELGVPSIALITTKGFRHFVLIKGVSENRVVVGDPSAGTRVINRKQFEEMWDGVVFLIRNKAATGRDHFNLKADWTVLAKAPFGTALSRQGLASITVHMRSGTNTF